METTNAILLRKLSFKSQLNFGKYKNQTVQGVIDLHKKHYLQWCYYNLEGISFTDEVLDLIQVGVSERLKKPGIYTKQWEEHLRLKDQSFKGIDGFNVKRKSKKRQIASMMCKFNAMRVYSQKGVLQSKNQGH